MQGWIEAAQGGRAEAAREVLRMVLASGLVDALLVPLRHPAGDAVVPALVKDRVLLELAEPFAPVLPVSAARLLGALTAKTPRPRVAAVLRNCELRAFVELVKFQQASSEGLVLIGLECTGTYEVHDYARIARGAEQADFSLRQACQMCEHPLPELADIVLSQIGLDDAAGLYVSTREGWGERIGLREAPEPPGRAAAVLSLLAQRTATRDRVLGEITARTRSPEGLAEVFSTCIRCHNCMTNCPICYCKTCFFKTDVFEHEPMQYLAWAERKGATRLPADSVLFHLTRMNHMSTSCVGCGLCTSACPAGIPVGAAFRAVGGRTQRLFGYVAGRSYDEAPPVRTFQVEELGELGEK